MSASKLLIVVAVAFLYSCNTQPENKTSDKAGAKDTLVPLKVTVIAQLPDSSQPKTIALNSKPKPLVVTVPARSGGAYYQTAPDGKAIKINLAPTVIKPLEVFKNEKGKPIVDREGKPVMMGDGGGKSNFTNFTTDNGLALDQVSCSKMDKWGNLWFGTDGGGVSRYDGKSFTSFTTAQGLTSNRVLSIVEDKSGNLWFGTWGGGVSRYDGKSFTNFTTAQGLASNIVWSIIEDKSGNLWFGTEGGGVSRYDGKIFNSFTTAQGLASNNVNSIVEDKSGNLWIGTWDGGVSRYDGKTFTNFTTAQGLASNSVQSIVEDKSGNLWFGAYGGGVSRYDGKTFTNFTTAQGLANNFVRSVVEDKSGNLWFGTEGGVSRYDGKSFTNFTSAQGLANNYVRSIVEDKSGNLWFGAGGGVSRYDGKIFNSFTTAQGLANNDVRSIVEDKSGNLWFGTEGGGVSRYDGKTFTNFTTAQGLASNKVRCIVEDKSGNLWFGTQGGGVSRYDGKSFTNFTTAQGLVRNFVVSIVEDKSGNLWFGTDGGGVSLYDGKSFTNFTTAQGLASNAVLSIVEDKSGNLWFGAYGGGVSLYDGKSFISFTTAHGLASNFVVSIVEDKSGNLWFGTEGGGVSRLLRKDVEILEEKTENVKKAGPVFFDNFTTVNGLANDVVSAIVEDKQRNIVAGTNLGFTLIPAKASALPFSTVKPDLEYYNSPNGYPVKGINTNALFCDSKGIIWAGTGSEKTGLVRFDYASLHKNEHIEPPTLVIQSVKVKDENICWFNLQSKNVKKNLQDSSTALLQEFLAYGKIKTVSENDSILKRFGDIRFTGISKFYPLPQNLVLPYAHNQIAFEFAAIETTRPFLAKYQYMLEGYDKDWSPVTNRSNANFGNIHEGTYTFKLKAQGANGLWCEPVSYTFKVLPPWYRTWWAYSIYALLFISGIGIFSKWRERNLRAEKEKLEKTVEERTSEVIKQKEKVESTLTQLKSTQAQLIQSEKLASLGELTAGIAHEIQNPMNFVNNFSEMSVGIAKELNDEINQPNIDKEYVADLLKDLSSNQEKINHHGKRASSIVTGMLEHSRPNTGVKEWADINKLCEDYSRIALNSFQTKNKSFQVEMVNHFDESLPKIEIVPQDIGRVIVNLINNAFYAVNERNNNSKNLLGFENLRGLVTITTQKTNNTIEIRVKDNGTGMTENVRAKIFQPFFTTKPTGSGTGLGLSLAYDIITKGHTGTLKVESTEGAGSEFIITLPI